MRWLWRGCPRRHDPDPRYLPTHRYRVRPPPARSPAAGINRCHQAERLPAPGSNRTLTVVAADAAVSTATTPLSRSPVAGVAAMNAPALTSQIGRDQALIAAPAVLGSSHTPSMAASPLAPLSTVVRDTPSSVPSSTPA